jgi:hypothetical protein
MSQISHARLHEVLHFDAELGIFTWKVQRKNANIGDVVANKHRQGYLYINIDGKSYLGHRLAWFYVYEVWPEFVLDHINHNKLDNRISNLRSVTQKENGKNIANKKSNLSGMNGVCFRSDGRKNPWHARVMHNRKEVSLGHFSTFEEAAKARADWDKQFWSEVNQ